MTNPQVNTRVGQLALVVNWEKGEVAPLFAVMTREEAIALGEEQLRERKDEGDEIVIIPATILSR